MIGFFKKGCTAQEEIPPTAMPDELAWHQLSAKGSGFLTASFDFGLGEPEVMGVIDLSSGSGPLIVFGIADGIVLTPSAGAEFDVCYRYQGV